MSSSGGSKRSRQEGRSTRTSQPRLSVTQNLRPHTASPGSSKAPSKASSNHGGSDTPGEKVEPFDFESFGEKHPSEGNIDGSEFDFGLEPKGASPVSEQSFQFDLTDFRNNSDQGDSGPECDDTVITKGTDSPTTAGPSIKRPETPPKEPKVPEYNNVSQGAREDIWKKTVEITKHGIETAFHCVAHKRSNNKGQPVSICFQPGTVDTPECRTAFTDYPKMREWLGKLRSSENIVLQTTKYSPKNDRILFHWIRELNSPFSDQPQTEGIKSTRQYCTSAKEGYDEMMKQQAKHDTWLIDVGNETYDRELKAYKQSLADEEKRKAEAESATASSVSNQSAAPSTGIDPSMLFK